MRFAKIVFVIAGCWGFLILTPMYFLLGRMNEQNSPAVTHPEFYYGFVGLALVWQLAFFIMASDPVGYRPLMVAAILEKFSFVVTVLVLARSTVIGGGIWVGASADCVLGLLFIAAYVKTARLAPASGVV
jgi:hypothetical protein